MTDILKTIAASTAVRVETARHQTPLEKLKDMPFYERRPADMRAAFTQPGINILAEIKFASPSAGTIHNVTDPTPIARAYISAGAKALSILTEPERFLGSLDYLKTVREALPDALLLRKDFMLDAYQLHEARAYGADAILLIVAMLEPMQLRELYQQAGALGLTTLIEVHNEAELEIAAAMNACFIGVNNRNLKTMDINLETSRRLAKLKPAGSVFLSESGISAAVDISDLRTFGYDGFLIGSSLMKSHSPGDTLASLIKAAQCA